MKVPLEVVVAPFFAESTVLAIPGFEPGKVTFQGIG